LHLTRNPSTIQSPHFNQRFPGKPFLLKLRVERKESAGGIEQGAGNEEKGKKGVDKAAER
jgi:hypothetical protein